MKARKRIMGVGSVVVALACAGAAQGATINVKPKPDALQKAIDKAKKGDTLKVKGGAYRSRWRSRSRSRSSARRATAAGHQRWMRHGHRDRRPKPGSDSRQPEGQGRDRGRRPGIHRESSSAYRRAPRAIWRSSSPASKGQPSVRDQHLRLRATSRSSTTAPMAGSVMPGSTSAGSRTRAARVLRRRKQVGREQPRDHRRGVVLERSDIVVSNQRSSTTTTTPGITDKPDRDLHPQLGRRHVRRATPSTTTERIGFDIDAPSEDNVFVDNNATGNGDDGLQRPGLREAAAPATRFSVPACR